MQRLHIFRAGTHTATDGRTFEFGETDLRATAAAYDPAKHEAPLVVGHPKTDDPAYGWTKSLAYSEGVLIAEPDQVEPQFAEMVNAGRFKKISARFYLPDAPGNPVPGVYYLRHVGFLGAQPPAVKGLKSASFAADEPGVIEFAEDWPARQNASLWRRIREFFIEKFSVEDADRVVPAYLIEDLEAAARGKDTAVAYAEPSQSQETDMKNAQDIVAEEARLKAEREQLERERAEFAERSRRAEREARARAAAEFVAGLVREGKVLPRDQAALAAFMVGPNAAGEIEFAEGGAQKTAKPDEWLRDWLARLPKQVDYAEHTARGAGEDAGAASFAAPSGYRVDPARLELHNKALAYQRAHPDTHYDAAVAAVSH